ncbi:MAG: hypothetical protein GY842_17790 [bacterium]|nr:hypothetical protein [bacterium]
MSRSIERKTVWVIVLGGVACALAVRGLNADTPAATDGAPPAQDAPADSSAAPQTQPATPVPPQDEADGAVTTPQTVAAEDVLKAFQNDRPTRVPIAPTGGSDDGFAEGDALDRGASHRLPDGFFLADRAGRAVKDGMWYVFAFEGSGVSHADPRLKLLPNQLLERMVLESESSPDDAVFIVSGEVTEYKSENYLLLRKVLRRRSLGNLEK